MTQRWEKLIGVVLLLKKINEQLDREKSICYGYPSTLHLWWARRLLAAYRAVLFAQFVDDPSNDPAAYQRPDGSVGEERATPCYIHQPFTCEPDFGVTSVNYKIEDLFNRGKQPWQY